LEVKARIRKNERKKIGLKGWGQFFFFGGALRGELIFDERR
jgi:hypothetical protein